jgi:hypothetical protein
MRTIKKLMAGVIAISMLISMSVSAFAIEEEDANTTENSREEYFIPEETAYDVALLFLQDARELADVIWDDDTEIVNTVVMYDETQTDAVTAYTFEMSSGYVVVSAYSDVPNIILEWSDQTAPLYKNLDVDENEKVVYLGALAYYKDAGADTIEDLNGNEVNRTEVCNVLNEVASEEYALESGSANASSGTAYELQSNDTISDPFTHATSVYGGDIYLLGLLQ